MNPKERARATQGVGFAVAAFTFWGFVPIFFKIISDVSAGEILTHRVLWIVICLAPFLLLSGRITGLRILWERPRVMGLVLLASMLIAINWLVFLWAVLTDRVLETSLGYFINPLVNVVLGVVFLRERLRRAQFAAVLVAAAGVVYLILNHGSLPWIAIVLPITFGFYGLIKSRIPIDAVNGLLAETLVLSPFALAYFVWLMSQGQMAFGGSDSRYLWLLPLAGPITLFPLVCFAAGARRIQLTTVGFIQYLAPSISFFVAIFAFHEALDSARLVAFIMIWISLAIVSADSLRENHRQRRAVLRAVEDTP